MRVRSRSWPGTLIISPLCCAARSSEAASASPRPASAAGSWSRRVTRRLGPARMWWLSFPPASAAARRGRKWRRRPAISAELPPIGERDHVLGADRPVVTLVEYGDFGCPYCFAAKRPIESLLDRYDLLRLVWRHFPDPELHPGADLAAELSEMAATDDRFWDAHGMLLAGRTRISPEGLLSGGRRLGFDPDDVKAALDDHRFREPVEEDITGGTRAGVLGTPTFFVNGERLVGHWRQLAHVVPAALGEAEK